MEQTPKFEAAPARDSTDRSFESERLIELNRKGLERRLSDKDFAELLSCEMALFAQNNPPLQGIFDPERELSSIRTLPQEERRGALNIFKDKLFAQRHGYMACRRLIERSIEHNPDVDGINLATLAGHFTEAYGFPPETHETILAMLKDYREGRQRILEVREKFPNDIELVHSITGIWTTKKDTTVSIGAFSIDILTTRELGELMRMETATPDVPKEKIAGFQSKNTAYKVSFTVTFDDVPDIERTMVHEQEHAKNDILGTYTDVFDPKLERSFEIEISQEKDPRMRASLIEEQLTFLRDQALDNAKDEMTAMLKDGTSSYFQKLTAKDGGSYDFLKFSRDAYANSGPEWANASQKVLVQEYDRIILKAREAFDLLKIQGGYTNDEAIALLTDVPLEYWPSTLRHL